MTRLATLALSLAALVLVLMPGSAEAAGGAIKHYSPDQGYNAPLLVRGPGFTAQLAEGQTRGDLSGIYIPSGEQVACTTDGVHFSVFWDATGWHNFGPSFGAQCVNQLD